MQNSQQPIENEDQAFVGPAAYYSADAQFHRDSEHLKILSICYYVSSGLTLIFALFPAMYMFIGLMFISGGIPSSGSAPPPPQGFGWILFVLGLCMTLVVLTLAVLEFIVARRLVQRRSRVMTMIVAGISCMSFPIGTTLGVFTFIILSRPSVVASYDREQ